MNSTGNHGLDALADAIAERVISRLNQSGESRLLNVNDAAAYIGRTPKALRHMISSGAIPAVREGSRVHLDRTDLDQWVEMRKVRGYMLTMAGHTRGTGTIYRRGNVYWIQYFVHGRQVNESTKSTDEAEAQRILKVKVGEAAAGRDVTPERATVDDLCALVVADYRLRKLRDAENVKWRIDAHIKPAIGSLLASRFTPHQVRQYVELRRKNSASDATINREMAIVRCGFSLGLREDPPLVRRAPYITKLEEDNVRQGFIEQGQYLALRAALPDHLKALLVVGYHCGNRLGELRKLCWSQVDMEAGEIRIEKSQAKSKKPRTLRSMATWSSGLSGSGDSAGVIACSPGSSQRSVWMRKRRHWAHT